LVTGGSGFIGRNLASSLSKAGHSVRVLDIIAPSDHSVDYVSGDIQSYESVLASLNGIDSVVHLAARISVAESLEKPQEYNAVNVTGSLNVMKACVEAGVPRLIYISSAAVYGNPAELPLKETTLTMPLSPYGASKLAPEFYAGAFFRSYGLETAVLRLFNVYGPGQPMNDYSGVITKFIERIHDGKSPIIYGTGDQSRDFIHIKDIVKAIELAVGKEGIAGETFNIASGEPVTIGRLAEMMLMISGKENLKPTHVAVRPADIMHSYTDISKAKKILGFAPSISLEDGLKSVLFSG
jgi:UDP-glucose 4-epimerase